MSKTPASLVKLFSDHWDAYMRWDPIYATMCGDHRFDDQLGNLYEDAAKYYANILMPYSPLMLLAIRASWVKMRRVR